MLFFSIKVYGGWRRRKDSDLKQFRFLPDLPPNGYESISLDCPFGHFVLILNKVWSRWIPNQVGSSTFFFGLIVGEIMIGVS